MSISNFLPSRRWFLRILLGLLTLIVTTVAGRWLWWERTRAEGEKELAAAIAETDALDPRWRWEQIEEDRPKVPDEENSILVLKRFFESLPMNRPDQSWNRWDPAKVKLNDRQKLLPEEFDNRLLDDGRLALIRKEWKDHQSSVELAVALKDYPRGRAYLQVTPDVLGTRLPHVEHCLVAGSVLALDSERLLHDRGVDDTCLRIKAILNVGASLRGESTAIIQLVRMKMRSLAARRVERALALAEVRAGDLNELQLILAQEEAQELLVPALRGERAFSHILFENLDSGKFNELDGPIQQSKSFDETLGWTLYRARLPADHAYYLRRLSEAIVSCRLPYHEQLDAMDEQEKHSSAEVTVANENRELLISALLLPAVKKIAEAAIRDKAILRCTITALAAERFRTAKNDWPKKLDDLCPKYMKKILLDPFDGEPLKYIFREDGVTIYSVGVNGLDDGGTNLTPTGKGPGADLGFRLWNVDQRGLDPVTDVKAKK